MSQDQSDSGAWQPRVQLPCGDCYTPCNLVKRARAQYKNGYCKLECQTETSQIHQFSYVTILVEGTKVKKTCKEPLSSEVLSKYGMLTPPEIMEFSIALNEALMRGLGDVQCTQVFTDCSAFFTLSSVECGVRGKTEKIPELCVLHAMDTSIVTGVAENGSAQAQHIVEIKVAPNWTQGCKFYRLAQI